MKKLLVLVLALFLGVALVGCGSEDSTDKDGDTTTPPTAETVTLTFDSKGGTEFEPLTAKPFSLINLAGYTPEKEGALFSGWFFDEAFTKPVSNVMPKEDSTAYAKYKFSDLSTSIDLLPAYTIGHEPLAYTVNNNGDSVDITAHAAKDHWSYTNTFITFGSTDLGYDKIIFEFEGEKDFEIMVKLEAKSAGLKETRVTMTGSAQKFIWDISDVVVPADGVTKLIIFMKPGGNVEEDVKLKINAIDLVKTFDTEPTATNMVYFNTYGGTLIAPFTGNVNDTFELPADPKKAGYSFKGWYTDYNFTTLFDNSNKIKAGKTVVYAKFEKLPDVTLTFEDFIDGNDVKTITVGQGMNLWDSYKNGEIPTPSKEGSVFVGWFLEDTFVTAFTDKTPINSDMTVYAKYRTVTIDEASKVDISSNWESAVNKTVTETANGFDIEVGAGGWDSVKFDAAAVLNDDVKADYQAVRFTVSGTEGLPIIVKINENSATEVKVFLTTEPQTITIMVPTGIDTSKKFLIFTGFEGDVTTGNVSFSDFGIYKVK